MSTRLGYVLLGSAVALLVLILTVQVLILIELNGRTTAADLAGTENEEVLQELVDNIPLVRVYGPVDVEGEVTVDSVWDTISVEVVNEPLSVEIDNEPLYVLRY